MKTNGGSSLIELEEICHEFKVGDSSHPQSQEIYSMLEEIIERLQREWYLANISQVLFDTDEEDKENALWHHSLWSHKRDAYVNYSCDEKYESLRGLPFFDEPHCTSIRQGDNCEGSFAVSPLQKWEMFF